MRLLLARFIDFYLRHHVASFAVAMALFTAGLLLTLQLRINSNQLDMLPRDLPQVQAVRRIVDMTGGVGFLVVTFKHAEEDEGDKLIARARRLSLEGKDREVEKLVAQANAFYDRNRAANIKSAAKLKKAADDISGAIEGAPGVQYVRHKFKLDFLTKHVLYRIETKDLSEAFRRIGIKRREMIEKADPFYIDLQQKAPYKLDLTDLYKKYSRIGKKEVIDDYYISPDRRMMLLLIKPDFDFSDIEKSTALTARVQEAVAKFGLPERGIKVEYTGAYAQFAYAYHTVRESLWITGILALVLIAIILFFFIRRLHMIAALLASLVYALVVTFGVSYLLFGELNLVTSMMGGILAGLGIDFGIHFISRFKEEMARVEDFREAVRESVLSTGSAAIWSASTTAAAFIALILSDFRGFSEFGVLAAIGILITALTMFFFTPLQFIVAMEFSPRFLDYLKATPPDDEAQEARLHRLNLPKISRWVLIASLLLSVPAVWFAREVKFDYDSRNMLESDADVELLGEEMNLRFEIAGNPLAVAVPTLEEYHAIWDYFEPLPKPFQKYVVNVVNMFGFVPPRHQQLENQKLIAKFRRDSSVVKRGMVPERYRGYWGQAMEILNAKPFSHDDLPDYITDQFRNIKSSEHKGYLTFIYPDVRLLHLAPDIIALKDLLKNIRFPMVARRDIAIMAYSIPRWEKQRGRAMSRRGPAEDVDGLKLNARERAGVLDIANHASEDFLAELKILPGIRKIIIKNRPYASVAQMRKEHGSAVGTGSTVLVALFAEIVLQESQQILIYTFVLVVLILFVSFRRIDHTLLSLIPLAVGLAFTFAAMAIFGVKLNFFNTAVLPVIVGYGINNGIFIFRRFLESGDISASVVRTGTAVVASSLTTLAGWGSLAAARHPGLRSMGVVACIGLFATMITAIVVLPAVLELYARRQNRNLETADAGVGPAERE